MDFFSSSSVSVTTLPQQRSSSGTTQYIQRSHKPPRVSLRAASLRPATRLRNRKAGPPAWPLPLFCATGIRVQRRDVRLPGARGCSGRPRSQQVLSGTGWPRRRALLLPRLQRGECPEWSYLRHPACITREPARLAWEDILVVSCCSQHDAVRVGRMLPRAHVCVCADDLSQPSCTKTQVFSDPVQLEGSCTHNFCRDCITLWATRRGSRREWRIISAEQQTAAPAFSSAFLVHAGGLRSCHLEKSLRRDAALRRAQRACSL